VYGSTDCRRLNPCPAIAQPLLLFVSSLIAVTSQSAAEERLAPLSVSAALLPRVRSPSSQLSRSVECRRFKLHIATVQLLVVVLRRCSTIVSLARVCGSATWSCTSYGLYRENQYKRRETWWFPVPQEANARGQSAKPLLPAISLGRCPSPHMLFRARPLIQMALPWFEMKHIQTPGSQFAGGDVSQISDSCTLW
jgi:hypothetical protein